MRCCQRGAGGARMSTRERLFLTPIEKLRKYGIVPWKLILSTALLILVTTQVVLINTQESAYLLAANRNWFYFFFPAGFDFSDEVTFTFTMNDTVDAVQRAVVNYYSLNTLSPDAFGYDLVPSSSPSSPDQELVPSPPVLSVTRYVNVASMFRVDGGEFQDDTVTTTYTLNQTFFGPVDYNTQSYDELRDFFNGLVSMRLQFPPIHNFAFGSIYRNCFLWSVAIDYDFQNRGQVQISLDQDIAGSSCDSYLSSEGGGVASLWDAWADKLLWLNFVVIAVSVVHTSLLIKAMVRSFFLMRRIRTWALSQAARFSQLAAEAEAKEAAEKAAAFAEEVGSRAAEPSRPAALSSSSQRNLLRRSSSAAGTAGVGGAAAGTAAGSYKIEFHTDLAGLDGSGEIFVTAAGGEGLGLPAVAPSAATAGLPSSLRQPSTILFDLSESTTEERQQGVASPSPFSSANNNKRPPSLRRLDVSSGYSPLNDADEANEEATPGPYYQQAAASASGASSSSFYLSSSGIDSARPASASASASASGPDILSGGVATAAAAAAAAKALSTTWESLSWRDKLRFINGWAILSIVADSCNITSSVWNLSSRIASVPSDDTHAFIMGLGIALLWIGVIRYLEHNRTYFNIVLTLRRAGPRVLRFLVGVLPIFIAYSLFAVVMFSDRVPRFCDPRTAFITLFANLNGDVIRETFMAIVAHYPVLGQFYVYSFIALHVYVVLNIIIAVVEESYFITVTRTQELEDRAEEEAMRAEEARKQVMEEQERQLQQEQAQRAANEAAASGLLANEAEEKQQRMKSKKQLRKQKSVTIAAGAEGGGGGGDNGKRGPPPPPPPPAPSSSAGAGGSGTPAAAAADSNASSSSSFAASVFNSHDAAAATNPSAPSSSSHPANHHHQQASSSSSILGGFAPGPHPHPHPNPSPAAGSSTSSTSSSGHHAPSPATSTSASASASASAAVMAAAASVITPRGSAHGPGAGSIDLLSVPAKADSNSLKERPDNKLAALLRLSEWDEVMSGKASARSSVSASATTVSPSFASSVGAVASAAHGTATTTTTPTTGARGPAFSALPAATSIASPAAASSSLAAGNARRPAVSAMPSKLSTTVSAATSSTVSPSSTAKPTVSAAAAAAPSGVGGGGGGGSSATGHSSGESK